MKSFVKTHIYSGITAVITLFLFASLGRGYIGQIFAANNWDPQQNAISVNALVPPLPKDYQLQFDRIGGSDPQMEDRELEFQITYGASDSASVNVPMTLRVDYSNDLAPNKSHLLDYVFGSATKAYGDTEPIIDQKNRTITWYINNFPAGTMDQTVRFKLRTINNYNDDLKKIGMTITAQFSNEYMSLERSIGQSYLYIIPTPGPVTPRPTTPTPTSSPTPEKTLQFRYISFEDITATSAAISIWTTQPAKQLLYYGIKPNALNNLISGTNYSAFDELFFTGLTPNTQYYFKLKAIGTDGTSITSDFFTFFTAKSSVVKIKQTATSVTYTSGGLTLASHIFTGLNNTPPFILLPVNTDYDAIYVYDQPVSDIMQAMIVSNLDGIAQEVQMQQRDARTFNAQLHSSSNKNLYEIKVKIIDTNGNVLTKTVGTIKVVQPMLILEDGTNNPLSKAMVQFSRLNPTTNTYEAVSGNYYSDERGQVHILLLPGKYKAAISDLFYGDQTVDFTLGPNDGEVFPVVHLKKDLFNFSALITFLLDTLQSSYLHFIELLIFLASSSALYNALVVTTLASSLLLSWLLFHIRTLIHPRDLLPFFIFSFMRLVRHHPHNFISGTVRNDERLPVSRAVIEVVDLTTGKIVATANSNMDGKFYLRGLPATHELKLLVTKAGYQPTESSIHTDDAIPAAGLTVFLHHGDMATASVLGAVRKPFAHLAGEGFEVFLLLSIISEMLFAYHYGLMNTLPFLILSYANLLLWLFYLKEKKI